MLNPLIVSRNDKGKVLIETSVGSMRISIAIQQADEMERIITHMFTSFFMQRAESFITLRQKSIQRYDISFLVINAHTELMYKHKLVDFIIDFMEVVDSEISKTKIGMNERARIVAGSLLLNLS